MLDVCSFCWSFVCSFLSQQTESVSGSGQAAVPPFLGAEPTCTAQTIPAFHTKAALVCQEDVVFSVSEQERSHINTVTQLPFPAQDSSVTICQIWSVQSSRKVWVYTTLFLLFSFFLNTFWFLLQSKVKPGLEVLKKQYRNGELTKNQSDEFSISARLHTGIW